MAENRDFIRDIDIAQPVNTDGQAFEEVRKKTERVAGAIYLITDFFPDKEPIKWLLREGILQSMSQMLFFKLLFLSKERVESAVNGLEVSLAESLSLLNTAQMAGLISTMNYSVLSGEFMNLERMIKDYGKLRLNSAEPGHELGLEFFGEESNGQSQKGQIYDKFKMFDKKVLYKKDRSPSIKDKNIKDNKIWSRNIDSNTGVEEKNRGTIRKNYRQIKIIELIKDKNKVSIKDISSAIKDCSEKTIQREITAMVNSGVLKREGQKRWSRYSLNL